MYTCNHWTQTFDAHAPIAPHWFVGTHLADGFADFAALWLLVAFVTALHSLVFGHPRYRLPLTPVFAVYAGAAISGRVWQLRHERSGGWRLAMALCAGLAAIWIAQFVLRDWPRVQQLMEAAA